jgi:hypothetical protein
MGERTLVDYVLQGMKPHWRCPVKHSDAYTAGIADLSAYMVGVGNIVLELKALERWPTRARTVVKFTCYTDEQKRFLWLRQGTLLLRCKRDYLLFAGREAIYKAGSCGRGELETLATAKWRGRIDWEEFAGVLQQRCDPRGGWAADEALAPRQNAAQG